MDMVVAIGLPVWSYVRRMSVVQASLPDAVCTWRKLTQWSVKSYAMKNLSLPSNWLVEMVCMLLIYIKNVKVTVE